MAQILIHRGTNIAYERDVEVFTDGKRYRVDPEHEVSSAVGIRMSREGCIVSMAEGFVSNGHIVLVSSANSRIAPITFQRAHYRPKLVFYLFGLAWIRGEWSRLRTSLEYIRPELRLRVLEYTAQYYIDRPYGEIKLLVP